MDWNSYKEWGSYSAEEFEGWVKHNPQRKALFEDVLPFIKQVEQTQVKLFDTRSPIVEKGNPNDGYLYLLLRGNAFLYATTPSLALSSLPGHFIAKLRGGKAGLREIKKYGHFHRFILCEGDLIGEYEILDKGSYISTIVSGLPFPMGHPRVTQQTIIMRIFCQDLIDNRNFHAFIQEMRRFKIQAVDQMLHALYMGNATQLGSFLCLCLRGYLPVMSPELIEVPPRERRLSRIQQASEATAIYLPQPYLPFLTSLSSSQVLGAIKSLKDFEYLNVALKEDIGSKKHGYLTCYVCSPPQSLEALERNIHHMSLELGL